MHSRNPALWLLAVALLAAGAFFLRQLGARPSPARPGAASVESRDRSGPVVPRGPEAPGESPGAAVAERTAVTSPAAGPPPAGSPSGESEPPTGLVVRGTVRFADDDTPAGGVRFQLRCPGGTLDVRADDQGRFRSEPRASPGIAQLVHRPSDPAGDYPTLLRFSPASVSLPASGGEEVAIELRLERPEAELPVRVLRLGGRSAAGATVELQLRHELRPGELTSRFTPIRTDEGGRARFALYDLELLRAAGLIARLVSTDGTGAPERLVSSYLVLDPSTWSGPRPGEVELVLEAAASLLVHARDESGADVPDERLWIQPEGPLPQLSIAGVETTDAAGRALFEGLPAGSYSVHRGTGPGQNPVRTELGTGERVELELVLPLQAERLAVAGRVVDEAGAPLADVSIRAHYGPREGPGDTTAAVTTDPQGRFELHAPPCNGVTLRSDEDIFGDEFVPALVEVPFGTTDVLFTRVRSIERRQIEFEIVDAATAERLDEALVMTYRAPNLGEYSFHRATGGLASPLCSLHPATTLVIELAGYRRATVRLEDLLAHEPVDGLRRIALDRGLLRRLRVEGLDPAGEQAPVSGALIRLGDRILGTTDARGEVQLDLYRWPEGPLTVEAAGFLPASWEPADGFADLEPGYVWLQRE